MAISFKGKGKKIGISMVVVALLMMAGGSLTAGLLGGRSYEYVLMGILFGYSVWFSILLSKDVDKAG